MHTSGRETFLKFFFLFIDSFFISNYVWSNGMGKNNWKSKREKMNIKKKEKKRRNPFKY